MFQINSQLKKRMNSSMSFEDYQQPPPTPRIRPINCRLSDIPEILLNPFDLTESPLQQLSSGNCMDQFQDSTIELEGLIKGSLSTFSSCTNNLKINQNDLRRSKSDQRLKRKRTTIHFNCLNFMEQLILKKIHLNQLKLDQRPSENQ